MAHYFSDEEILAGWTESFTTKQIAMLQRHPKRIAIEPIKLCIALFNKLSSDCRLGAIPAALQETPKTVRTPFFAEFNSSTLTGKEAYLLGEAKGKKLADQLKSFVKPGPTIETYRVTAHDFKDWLKLQREMPSTHVQAWFDAVIPLDQNASDVLATTAPSVKPVQRSAAQDAAILATLQTLNVDPLAVPKNSPGKPGTKAKVRAELRGNPLFTGTTIFDRTWERLTSRGEIVIRA